MSTNQSRERATGRYAFDGRWERLCTCGHKLGLHTAEAPHECMNGDLGLASQGATGTACDCKRFRPSKAKETA